MSSARSSGGPAFHSGPRDQADRGPRGLFSPEDVRHPGQHSGRFSTSRQHACSASRTRQRGGGVVWPLDQVREVCARERTSGLGCTGRRPADQRLGRGSGVPAADYGREFDTVTLCLSKGLGCPLGAARWLRGAYDEGRRLKHLSAAPCASRGSSAAAGVYALDHMSNGWRGTTTQTPAGWPRVSRKRGCR